MPRKPKFKPVITRVKLNPEQAVLSCDCWSNGITPPMGAGMDDYDVYGARQNTWVYVCGMGSKTHRLETAEAINCACESTIHWWGTIGLYGGAHYSGSS